VFAAHHEQIFVFVFFKVSNDHLFDNLESGKEILIFVFEKKIWIQKSVQTLNKHGKLLLCGLNWQ